MSGVPRQSKMTRPACCVAVVALLGCRKQPDPASDVSSAASPASSVSAAASGDEAAKTDDPMSRPGPDVTASAAAREGAGDASGGSIAGVEWGAAPEAGDLPDAPVSARADGEVVPIVRAVAGRLPDVADSPLLLDLFTAQPPSRCALHVGAGAATSGYLFALGPDPVVGQPITYHGKSERDAQPPVYALLNVRAPGGRSFRTYGDGDAVVVVDSIDEAHIRGRVYGAFRDPGKSMVVGRFDAEICADTDVR